MKKAVKIIGIFLLLVVAAMAVAPFVFKDKVKTLVLSEANKLINAEFGFGKLGINLFSEFPKASVAIEDFWLRGKDEFDTDTLAYVGHASVAVDLKSLFGNGGFDITKILVKDTYLKAIVLEDGRPNWDIMYPSEEEQEEDTTASAFRIVLQKVMVDNLNIIYDDRQANMYAHIEDFGATCSGDMAADQALLELKVAIAALTFKMDDIPLLNKANIGANINVDANFTDGVYTLKDNTLSLNAIRATVDGWAAMPTDAPLSMDLTLNTSDIRFKELLSLVPAIYAKDFEGLKAEGIVSLHAFAKGELTETTLPQFEAALRVSDANFRYPALSAGIDDIQVAASVSNPGGDIDLTQVQVERFSFNMLDNPFALTAQVKSPISDPDFTATAKGTLNLGKIKEVYPLEDISLNGIVKADMSLGGRLSYLENEQYDKFNAAGSLKLQDMLVELSGIPSVAIEQSTFAFTPRYLNLSETKVLIGDNDITADCRFENYMAFALKDEVLRGQLNIKSNHMNLNDFLSSSEDTLATDDSLPSAPEAEEATGVLVVPGNIDFNMNVDMGEIRFDNIILSDLNGKLIVKDGTADMSNLSMHTMGGTVVMNGSYSTAHSKTNPELKASFALNELSFAKTYQELNMVQQVAPIFENLKGNFSGKISVNTTLDATMSPQLETLTASGNLNTRNLNLSEVEVISRIADATGRDELKNLSAKDLNIGFTIEDGRISTQPFDIKMGSANLNLSGTTGLDRTIDYAGKLTLPQGGTISSIDLKIGGKFGSPQISIDTQSLARQVAKAATDKVAEKVTEAATEKVTEAIGQNLGIDLSSAEKQKEELVKAAEQAAQKLIAEAEKQKAALVSKAGSNAIKKLAAEKAGDKLIEEAKKKGDELVEKARAEGN